MAGKPLANLAGARMILDRRHDHRALPIEELRTILAAAEESSEHFRGLRGNDRAMCYATAMQAGFRVSELASLTSESIDFDARLDCLEAVQS